MPSQQTNLKLRGTPAGANDQELKLGANNLSSVG